MPLSDVWASTHIAHCNGRSQRHSVIWIRQTTRTPRNKNFPNVLTPPARGIQSFNNLYSIRGVLLWLLETSGIWEFFDSSVYISSAPIASDIV